MPRGYSTTEATYAPLLVAMQTAGDEEWSAPAVMEFFGIADRKNVARFMQKAIDLGLLHRVRRGAASFYRIGPDPEAPEQIGDFEPALYGDGTLVLMNCPLNANGVPQLNRAQSARVKKLLTGDLV